MSLIKCPECGQDVSDKAKKCIHCGKELFHCPECGKTTVRHGNTCPQCGYELSEAPKPAMPSAEEPQSAPNPAAAPAPETSSTTQQQSTSDADTKISMLKEWKAACPAEAKRKKILSWVNDLCAIGAIIPILLLALQFFGVIFSLSQEKLSGLNVLERLQYFTDCRKFINNAFIASLVLDCLSIVSSVFVSYWEINTIAAWLKKGTFDTVQYLSDYKQQQHIVEGEEKWAAYCAFSPKGKFVWGLHCIFVDGIVGKNLIFLIVALQKWALLRLDDAISGMVMNYDAITRELVSIAAAMGAILLVVVLICWIFRNKFIKSFTSQNKQKS